MEALSITMEKAYKPLKDSSTVVAAERLMAQIASEAEKLASSTRPDNVNDETVKKKLEKLRTDARALANEIATGTEDDVIGTDFHKIHDLYQEIHDAWKRGSKSSL
jgi:DNA-binding transcriptional regulator YhcF (GntR family)